MNLQQPGAGAAARAWLDCDDSALLAACRMEAFRGSGPGGQKRNKTSSAVRLVHESTGLSGRAEESRSQQTNRRRALERLRMEIALHVRAAPAPIDLSRLRPADPRDVAAVLDWLHDAGYALSDAAHASGTTTAALSSFVCSNEALMTEVNRQRALRKLRPLRA